METQEYTCCYDANKKCKNFGCLSLVAIILAVLFFFVIGGLIGAAIAETVLGALAVIIVLAIILGILFLLTVIFMYCKNARKCK